MERKKRKRAPENETAKQKFARVTNKRLENIFKFTELLSKMKKSQTYEFDADHAQEVIASLEEAITNLKESWEIEKLPESSIENSAEDSKNSEENTEELQEVTETVSEEQTLSSPW